MDTKFDLSNEAGMSAFEWGLIIIIAVIAGVYLYRKYFVNKGCAGCASSAKGGCSLRQQFEANKKSCSSDDSLESEQVLRFKSPQHTDPSSERATSNKQES